MLLIILALAWVAVLTPILINRFRDHGTEKSINNFHTEHEVLARNEYAVAPAHRLDDAEESNGLVRNLLRRPRLTVVHADDTYQSIESRDSWNEWEENYEYDEEPRTAPRNRYAAAYSALPSKVMQRIENRGPVRHTSMQQRRKMMFTRLVAGAVVLTLLDFVLGSSFLLDLAVLAWVGVVAFIALAFYAVSAGYLNEDSLPIRLPQRQPLATVETLYDEAPQYEDDFDDEFYDPSAAGQWSRHEAPRRAFG